MLLDIPTYLYLDFCSSSELLSLRKTCRTLRKDIPKEWAVSDLYVTEDQVQVNTFSHSCRITDLQRYIHSCKFMGYIYFHCCKNTDIEINSRLAHLEQIVVTSLLELECLKINHTPNLKNLTVINAPKLKHVELPTFCKLEKIYLFYTQLESLVIPPCSQLKSIVFSSVGIIDTLEFPTACTNLELINASNSVIRTIKILGILKHKLHIEGYHPFEITIHTPLVNKDQIHIEPFALVSWIHDPI